MSRPIHARIDLSALTHNLGVARGHAPESRLLAVIKANGYGHGMLRVARALADADGFAVLTLEEGIGLREAGFDHTILLLEGFFGPDELPALAEYRLASVIHCDRQVEMLARSGLPARIEVFLKLNTGMNRLGFKPEDFPAVLARLKSCGMAAGITAMTHFASADEAPGVAEQLALFQQITMGLGLPASLANSAAILRHPETCADWARPGIMLYGISPLADRSAADLGLRPAMTVSSELIAVQHLKPGEALGYGGAFRAEVPMRVGIVACGYADGYPRHAPTGTPILVNGLRTRILGRVSMDMLFADITHISDADIGSPVTLWGQGLPVEEVAQAAGTISYELLCAVASRVPVVEE